MKNKNKKKIKRKKVIKEINEILAQNNSLKPLWDDITRELINK
jgi:hypothetical protein